MKTTFAPSQTIPVHLCFNPRSSRKDGRTQSFCWINPMFNGSSPLVRGTFKNQQGCVIIDRFIPARAGNIRTSPVGHVPATVHPRSCGEHSMPPFAISSQPGSSPLVRGTYHQRNSTLQFQRFIPARAGNIRETLLERCPAAVHPRSCGEHKTWAAILLMANGSSPLVRGT